MIICSCLGITDKDIERALAEVSRPAGRLPTPGIVYRRLEKRMVCCGCAPLVLSTIREKIDRLDGNGTSAPLVDVRSHRLESVAGAVVNGSFEASTSPK